jgi:two-component system, LytTR family, sensor kinase
MRLTGRQILWITLAWALFGCLHGTQVYFGIRAESPDYPFLFGRFLAWQVGCWLVWAPLTLVVVWLSRRFPLAPRAKPIALHLAVSLFFAFVQVAGMEVMNLVVQPFGPPPPRPWIVGYLGRLSSFLHVNLIVYWAICGVVHAVDSRRRLRERELEGAQIEAQLAQAQLANLRLQLQPHFLFNTLHAIASLVRGGESGPAVAMIAGLSDLLRYSLDNAGKNVVPLSEEMDVVERYLEIQRTRFSDRLEVAIRMSEETRDAAVPTLLLQPLVENAVRHGIAASADGGRLEVRAHREAGDLVIEVLGDGPPLPPDWRDREGVGLSSTRGRLQQLYGSGARLELENHPPAGVVARVRIPFSRELGDG